MKNQDGSNLFSQSLATKPENLKEFVTINPFSEQMRMDEEVIGTAPAQNKKIVEPENPTGAWSIFDGKFKAEQSNKLFPEIKLHTFESYAKCTEFPQMPLNLVFRETTELSDLCAMFESQMSIANTEEGSAFKFLTGSVQASGLSRNMFNSEFAKQDAVYSLQYASNAKIFIINFKHLKDNWLDMLMTPEDKEKLNNVDCDFHFMITSDRAETQFSLEPKAVQKIDYKSESNFNNNAFDFTGMDFSKNLDKNKTKTVKLSKFLGVDEDKENNIQLSAKVSSMKEEGKKADAKLTPAAV